MELLKSNIVIGLVKGYNIPIKNLHRLEYFMNKNTSNKSRFLLLFVAFAILAGTVFGIFNVALAKSKPKIDPANQPTGITNYPRRNPNAPATTEAGDASVFDQANAEEDTVSKDQEGAPNKDAAASTSTTTPASVNTQATETTPVTHNYSILIKKSSFQCFVLDNGKVIETYNCALGKNTGDKERSGDMKTPVGTFKVIEVCDASYWTHDFHDGKGEIAGAYGPWFFYLDTSEKSKGQWDGIGIHGTHDPSSIGQLISEGCIRLLNENIEILKEKYIKVGTMVTIEE